MSRWDGQILPGQTIGVFGGGQLGRMLTHAAQRMGYRVVIFTPEVDSPAGQVAQEVIVANYDDRDALRNFAQAVDVVTLEFENIDLHAVREVEPLCRVHPSPEILRIAQHRFHEKSFLKQHGFPVTPFCEVHRSTDWEAVEKEFGWPVIIKTSTLGYDGKGQSKVSDSATATQAERELGEGPKIAEKTIEFQCEVSVLVARNQAQQVAVYPMFRNEHSHHILDVTSCPVEGPLAKVAVQAEEIARGVAEKLELIGLLCIEFFVTNDGSLLINEMAPRPHNSGHLTIEANATSQFEQQVRAICNLPLGETTVLQSAAMANLLGDIWKRGEPEWSVALAEPRSYLHLYGKSEARPGRKMGHLTCLAPNVRDAIDRVRRIRRSLRGD